MKEKQDHIERERGENLTEMGFVNLQRTEELWFLADVDYKVPEKTQCMCCREAVGLTKSFAEDCRHSSEFLHWHILFSVIPYWEAMWWKIQTKNSPYPILCDLFSTIIIIGNILPAHSSYLLVKTNFLCFHPKALANYGVG